MAADQIRQASKLLGPLLRRRGTSPELGPTLRRALQSLDKSLAGLPPQAQDAAVATAVADLRSCAQLIQQSERPADHDQRPGIEQALALLAPPEAPYQASAPPALAPGNQGTLFDAEGPVKRRRKNVPGAVTDFDTTGTLLMGLAAKLDLLHLVLTEPCFRMGDVHVANREVRRQVQAVTWLGRGRVPAMLSVADRAHGPSDRLVAGAALVHLGEGRGAELMMNVLTQAVAARQPIPGIAATVLRTVEAAGWLDWLREVFWKPIPAAVGGLLLPLLVEHNAITAEQLWDLVGRGPDDLAVAAARALPWSDGDHDARLLVAWARTATTPSRAHALLFAAAVLGSAEAVAEIRARLHDAVTADPLLVDALAVAGAAQDAELLTALAARSDADAAYLLLAAAHLGSVQTLRALPSFADRVPARVLEEAGRMIDGQTARRSSDGALDPTVRYLRGQPWSVAGVLQCLGSTDENVSAQPHLALELRARTSQAPLSTLPLLLPSQQRQGLLADWASYYAKTGARMQPGGWYYQGH